MWIFCVTRMNIAEDLRNFHEISSTFGKKIQLNILKNARSFAKNGAEGVASNEGNNLELENS